MPNTQACFPITMDRGPDGKPAGTLNQITKIRMADGREVAIVDWSWRPLYSIIDTMTGWTDTELRAFSYAQGDGITVSSNMSVQEVATLKHTNVEAAGEMPSTEEFLCYALCVEMYQVTKGASAITDIGAREPVPSPNNIGRLHHQCILELEVSQKAYFQASVGAFPAGYGVTGFSSDGSNVYGGNSVASREAIDMAPVPVHIGGTEKFAAILNNPDGTAINYYNEAATVDNDMVMRLRINLYGMHKRPSG